MISAIVVIVVFSILIIVHEFGHLIMAKRCGVKVERFSIGFGPKVMSLKVGETEYRVSLVPLGGYVKLAGETHEDRPTGEPGEFLSKPPGKRFLILIFGPFLNYVLGFLLFSAVFMIGSPVPTNMVGGVLDDYPAKRAGIKPGDKVIAIDGQRIEYWNELTSAIREKLDDKLTMEIVRDGRILELKLEPKIEEHKDIFGKMIKVPIAGITASDEMVYMKYGPLESFYRGAEKTLELSSLTLRAIWSLITNRLSVKESVSGPIGIFKMTAVAAKQGILPLLSFMGLISISLAIFNIFPIPVLDGGHILFLIIEKIRRRPLSPKVQEIAMHIGLGLLVMLMLFVSYYDILRFFKR